MDWTEYDQTVREWIARVEEYRGREAEKVLDYAGKIKQLGESTGDDKLLGFSYYYIAETCYMLNDVEKFFRYIMQGLEYLQRSKQWSLTAKACNLLGIASNNQGNAPFALDYYLSGVSVCEKYDQPQEKAMLEYNIGAIYMAYQEYGRAIHYIESSWAVFQTMKDDPQYAGYRNIVYGSLAMCYLELHDLKQADHYLSQIEMKDAVTLREVDELYFLCIRAKFYNELQDVQLRDNCIREIEQKLNPNVTVMEVFDDFYNYCQMLLEIEKFRELWKVLDVLDDMCRQAKLVHLQRKLLALKMEYYKKKGDNSSFLQASGLYYELSQMKEKEERYVTGSMLNVRFSLEEARKKQRQIEAENQLLHHRSETDSLTGIPNRMCLNHQAEEAFQRTCKEGHYFAVEMLDVDYFKEYNDNYGHQKGDDCLIAIAKELHKMTEHGNIFCARYGGDEFTLIYENYTPEEVDALARELKENIARLSIEHKFSKVLPRVTISQGICCDIPRKEDRVWDFLHSADVMLYRVKQSCRNGISTGKCGRESERSDVCGTDT